MTFFQLLIITTLASFTVTVAMVYLFIPILWCFRRAYAPAAARASWLFRLRLLPMASGLLVMSVAMVSFAWLEPPHGNNESAGVMLQGLAAAGFTLLAFIIGRLLHCGWRIRRAQKKWVTSDRRIALPDLRIPAYVIDTTFPIVALVGAVSPKLILARCVLAACSAEELAAVIAHECGHLVRWDNLRRVIIAAAPDLLAWLPLGRRIEEGLLAAIEEAADDIAVSQNPAARQHLAEALVRVARLAPVDHVDLGLPLTTLLRGAHLEHRVRRLLDAPDVTTAVNVRYWRIAMILPLLAASLFSLHLIHEIVEAAVRYLP